MMANPPALPPAPTAATGATTSTALAASAPTDAALAGVFSDELAQLLDDESGSHDEELSTPAALALLLSALIDAPTATAGSASPVGVRPGHAPQHVAQPMPAALDSEASLDGMLQELRAPPAAAGGVSDGPIMLPGLTGSMSAQAAATPALDGLASLVAGSGQATDARAVAQHSALRQDLPLQTPVGTQAWGDELATRIALLASDGRQLASVRLTPEHLGPLDIRIAVRGDEASVSFSASHPDTRAALEQALPRLRELFASQGLQLTHADVSGRDPHDAQFPAAHHALRGLTRDVAQEGEGATAVRMRLGLLDLYA
jgi:flagellar hook-length control protein FliK